MREWLHALDSLSLTICAASLAYHGLLGQAEKITCLCISNIDLTSVPNEHLAALASWMTSSCDVSINKTSLTSGIGLTSFLNSLKCHDLWIHGDSHGMILGREETDALVQAMESSVKMVGLDSVTMDMKTLFMYNGEGRCCEVVLTRRDDDPGVWRGNLKEPLKNWALIRDWAVIMDTSSMFQIKHKMCCK